MTKWLLTILPIIFHCISAGQTGSTTEQWDKTYTLSIQDNSFLVEEALNQEEHVVQHISNARYYPNENKFFNLSFTQEWPLWSMRHQFSYQFQYIHYGGPDGGGIGDIMLNYRYQLLEKESGVAVAPRASLIIPTGDETKNRGMSVVGYEFCLPASRRFSESLIAHANLVLTLFPGVAWNDIIQGIYKKELLPVYTAGGSLIWLIHPELNLMFEYLAVISGEWGDNGEAAFSTVQIINPGVRTAINFEHLQIVPGVSIPCTLREGELQVGALLYLSFEHDF